MTRLWLKLKTLQAPDGKQPSRNLLGIVLRFYLLHCTQANKLI